MDPWDSKQEGKELGNIRKDGESVWSSLLSENFNKRELLGVRFSMLRHHTEIHWGDLQVLGIYSVLA